MSTELTGKKVAILATDGFEQSELLEPKAALENAGATTSVVSPESGSIKGWDQKDWGDSVPVDLTLDDADPGNFHAILLPGGQMNPDVLRTEKKAVTFIKHFVDSGKPVAAICHAPWLLIEAGVAKGRKVTSWPSLKKDLTNAGFEWVDQEVVCDQAIITSRNPDDIPAFNAKFIEEIAEGKHDR